MAGTERKSDVALRERLAQEGHRFRFFQAVQLLHRLNRQAIPVGELGPIHREPVRFRHDPELSFHAGDVKEILFREDPLPPVLTCSFLGLTGAVSPLPTSMCEDLLHTDGEEQDQLADFYDILHHRLISLLYRVWKKYRFAASFRTGGTDPFTRRVSAFVGIDAVAVPKRGLAPNDRLALAPLLAFKTRPAWSLRLVLQRLLGQIPVRIEQFTQRTASIDESQRVRLGQHHTTLNRDLTIGRRVLDRAGRFRVAVGPLPHELCEQLMPGGRHYPLLRDVVNHFTRGVLEAELEVELDAGAAVPLQLGDSRSAILGVNTRLPTRRVERSVMRAVLTEEVRETRPEILSIS